MTWPCVADARSGCTANDCTESWVIDTPTIEWGRKKKAHEPVATPEQAQSSKGQHKSINAVTSGSSTEVVITDVHFKGEAKQQADEYVEIANRCTSTACVDTASRCPNRPLSGF
jgi:hypothetical protein